MRSFNQRLSKRNIFLAGFIQFLAPFIPAAAFLCELYPATCNKEREEWADWSPPFELPWPFRLPVPLFTSTLTLPKKDAILL